MKKLSAFLSRSPSISLPLLIVLALSTLASIGCGTTPTGASLAACPPVPTVDSSLLQKPKGLAAYSLPRPPAAASNAAATSTKLTDVAAEHTKEAAYTLWLETVVNGWQQWYGDLQKSYGGINN